MEKNTKKVEMNEELLEMVTGGEDASGYWDARCKVCGDAIGGAGIACFTYSRANQKVEKYNVAGCPTCGAKGSMERFKVIFDW